MTPGHFRVIIRRLGVHKLPPMSLVCHKKTGRRNKSPARLKSNKSNNKLLGRVGRNIGHNTAVLLPPFFCIIGRHGLRFTKPPGGNP